MITFTSSYGSVTLPNPILGNSEQHDIKTNIALSMSAKVNTYKRVPSNSVLLLQFVNLTESEYNDLLDFLINSRGMDMTYTDYDSVVWSGVIRNNPVEVTPDGPKICDGAIQSHCTGDNVQVASVTLEFLAVNAA